MQSQQVSLATRALLTLGLMIGFYLLAISVALALLYVPYAEWAYAGRLHVNLAFSCAIGAILILWSVVPRLDRFSAPGPRLDARTCPRLFEAIDGIASLTGQSMPAEVYLVQDLNAWVADRGGMLGFGSRRVMGLGLPLLQLLSVAQLRAVLAHEFGHFFAGDTKLGPWVYRTRAALGRTLRSLHGSVLQRPFVEYAKLFLRVSHAVARRQEFAADNLAARKVGAQALIEGLKRVHGAAPAFDSYWRGEVLPLLNSGFRPPIAEGFNRFSNADGIARAIDKHVALELAEGKADPYDTHPSLRERIAALEGCGHSGEAGEDAPAVSLLTGVEALEVDLLRTMSAKAGDLKPIQWQDAANAVYLPLWEEAAARDAGALQGVTLANLPEAITEENGIASRLRLNQDEGLDADQRKARAIFVTGAALAVLLSRHGWRASALPGEPVHLECNGLVVSPFSMLGALAAGAMTAEAWRELCAVGGIGELDLVPVSTASLQPPRPG